ncbi:hypothetical protein TSAR_004540, partial [Trichomalopsis sarcophagae]
TIIMAYDDYQGATIDVTDTRDGPPNLVENLEFWMTELPPKLRTIPVVQLAIPGSHNSMTYTIDRSDDVGPDEPELIRSLGRLFATVAKPIIFNWSINQNITIKDQLNGGIRYLDLRVATKQDDDKIYFLHGLYGAEVSQPLQQVVDWLNDHPFEVIIMDFQHLYNFTEADHRNLIDRVKYLFRGKLCPVSVNFDHVTLQWMNSEKYQVILVYRNPLARNFGDLWPTGLWPTPWPDTISRSTLIEFLNEGIRNRSLEKGYVSQCLFTPNATYILKHICRDIRYLSSKCRTVALPWIEEQRPGAGGLNVVITDDVAHDNFNFSKTVIQRNELLLGNSQPYYNEDIKRPRL